MRLGKLITLRGGGTPSKQNENYWNGNVPWASVKDFKSNLISKTVDSISIEGVNNSATRIVPAGTLLVITRLASGKVAFAGVDMAFNQDIKAIECKAALDKRFLYYFLQSKSNYFERVASGATVKGIKINHINDIEINPPKLEAQKEIVAILDEADKLRQLDNALIAKYDQLAQSLFLEMFGDPKNNPSNFEICEMNDIASKITDGDHATPKRTEKGYKLLSCRNIKNGFIDFESGLDYVGEKEFLRMRNRCNPEKGDILISCSGTIGRTTSIKIDEPFVLVRSAALIKPKSELVNSNYLEYYLRTPYMQAVMQRSSNTSSQSNLFTGPIKKLPLLLPPIKLQKEFASQVQIIETQKMHAQKALKKSETLFNSLLQRAFKGELVKA